jgi:hypothetical protein
VTRYSLDVICSLAIVETFAQRSHSSSLRSAAKAKQPIETSQSTSRFVTIHAHVPRASRDAYARSPPRDPFCLFTVNFSGEKSLNVAAECPYTDTSVVTKHMKRQSTHPYTQLAVRSSWPTQNAGALSNLIPLISQLFNFVSTRSCRTIGSLFARGVNIEGWRLKEVSAIHRLMRSANFTGTALLTFAVTTAIISPYHRYVLYAALAGIGTAAVIIGLCLAKRGRCEN